MSSAFAYTPPPIVHTPLDGATLLTITDDALPVVHFAVALRHGSIQDPIGRAGMTRVLMELMMRGTQARSRQAFAMALEKLGSSIDVLVSGEVALFRGIALKRNLGATLDLLTEAILTPALAEDEATKLIEELVENLRSERDEDDTVADIFLRSVLYECHVLARAPAGDVTELHALRVADLRRVHQQWLSRSLWVLGFAGDIRNQEAVRLSERLLHGMRAVAAPDVIIPDIPRKPGLRICIVDKPDRSQVQLRVATHGLPGHHPNVYGFWLGITAFGGTFTSILCREVRDIRGWSYVAHADFRRRSRFVSPVVLRSAPAVGDALNCLALELQLYGDLASGVLSDDALRLARSYLLNRYPFEVAGGVDMLFPAVHNVLAGLPIDEVLHVPEKLNALDLTHIPQLMSHHLDAQQSTVVMVATADKIAPALAAQFPHAYVNVVDFRDGLDKEL